MTTVVLADDQRVIREGLVSLLGLLPDIDVLGTAADGEEALALVERLRPDIVLMDLRMPRCDGVTATRRLCADPSKAPRVVVLTTFDTDEDAFASLQAGASGFLLKNSPPEEVLSAIRVVASGDAVVAPRVTRRLLDRFAGQFAPPRTDDARLGQLTEREREVMVLVAQGLSNAEIAAQLVVAEATVKAHVGRVLAKLGLRDRVQVVVMAYQIGLVRP